MLEKLNKNLDYCIAERDKVLKARMFAKNMAEDDALYREQVRIENSIAAFKSKITAEIGQRLAS